MRWQHLRLSGLAFCAALLVGCADSSGTAPRASTDTILPDSAEQIGFGVRVTLTNNSVAKGELLSDTSLTYDNGNRLELRRVNVTFYDATGAKDGQLTSREGTYNKRLNRLEARGDVVIVRESGVRLETPQLVFDELRNQIFSDSSFVLNEPPKRQITGVGFESDPQLTKLRVMKQAKSVIPVTVDRP
jgi:LPS export ABC transporter protein LptC